MGTSEFQEFADWIRAQRPQTDEEKRAFIAELRRRKARIFTPKFVKQVKQRLKEIGHPLSDRMD